MAKYGIKNNFNQNDENNDLDYVWLGVGDEMKNKSMEEKKKNKSIQTILRERQIAIEEAKKMNLTIPEIIDGFKEKHE